MHPGIYQLIIELSEEKSIQIGKLGLLHFSSGFYIYTGSALGGIESRIARHLRHDKRLHWHIDYLLKYARITDVIAYLTNKDLECQLNKRIMAIPDCIPIRGFGSSDCKCISHLAHFKRKLDVITIISKKSIY